ncbi:asparaginase [Rhodococcus rhodnii]|uniref:Asparaginase n=2 Tax=Rhodococcus rhodnii TaxID=38312 RepID=R7WHA2_9NOCA|nr:asparaginase [Rhodococcus rhodnii]EOM74397.1 hypothetical protein Rrhod_4199 [Rhodococcus rhodnii LMG 5362]TXG89111.1 asparaginase [Rhodococcus rhodnii]
MSADLVEVTRSGTRECVHRGSLVLLDPGGARTVALGSVDAPIFPRSTNKPWQAVAALRSGFVPGSSEELAIAAASHAGEPAHLQHVRAILARHGIDEAAIAAPPSLPANERERALAIAADAPPSPAYMECSGKHAAMLAACAVNDWPLESYLDPAHPMQLAVIEALAEFGGEDEPDLGIDGCGLPIVPLTLAQLAASFARLVSAPIASPEASVADAMRRHPYLVSGTGADDLALMSTVDGLVCKTGADGVFAGAFADGTAFAFKIDDGGERARLPLAAALAERHLGSSDEDLAALASRPVLGGGVRVGTVRAVPGIL